MIYSRQIIRLTFIITLLFSCLSDNQKDAICQNVKSTEVDDFYKINGQVEDFDRQKTLDIIKSKIADDVPLVIHVRIPLCDNDNQGIVPVGRLIGNGLDLTNNLYWGAKYGLMNHFRKHTDWKFMESKKDISQTILERVVFYKEFENNAKVYMIADAYRGDKMKECLVEYLNSLVGNRPEVINVDGVELNIGSDADLIVFNGHNGLMDYEMDVLSSSDGTYREAAVIGCVSHNYFKDHLMASKSYPVLMTTNLMAPEAYVLEAMVDSWSNLESGKDIRLAAGKAYHKYQKCGVKGATRLFRTGW